MDTNDEVIKMIFEKTLKENPRMTAQGLGVEGGKKVREAERKKLETSFNEFKIAIEYLRAIPRIEIFKKRCEIHSADLLKYYDQSISPGTIALAGRALGITVKNYQGTRSACLIGVRERRFRIGKILNQSRIGLMMRMNRTEKSAEDWLERTR